MPDAESRDGRPRRRPMRRPFTRRDFLRFSGLAATAGPLAACARQNTSLSGAKTGSAAPTLQIASPDHPVTWPIAAENQPIASGLTPEQGATLQLYNYADYIDPATIKVFEKKYAKYGIKVKVSTFNDASEALAKIRAGTVPFDIYFPSYDAIGKLVTAGLVRPLNHSYIPNIVNVWPEFQNPFYDGGWQYTVPYTIYTSGIAWRTDRVKEDIGKRPNPWDVLWDPQYSGKLAVLDDYRETISLVLLRDGNTDVNTADTAALQRVQQDLTAMTAATHPRVTITGYSDLPEGKFSLTHCWSGDALNMQYYLPKDGDPGILRYWTPALGKGLVNNDLMVILRGGKNPVAAHLFLNFMLNPDNALTNFGFVGYQPPQVTLTAAKLIEDGYIPANLKPATVLQGYFATGLRTLELPPAVDAQWQAVWQRFKAGA